VNRFFIWPRPTQSRGSYFELNLSSMSSTVYSSSLFSLKGLYIKPQKFRAQSCIANLFKLIKSLGFQLALEISTQFLHIKVCSDYGF
jgi:hypothetical protein